MHSFLIVGGSKKSRIQRVSELLKDWNIQPIDIVELKNHELSIGIKEIRQLQSRIILKPYTSPFTVAIIYTAELLTIEAQQALLKTLEEPPRTTRVILETSVPDVLLPTILSRCQILTLQPETIQLDNTYIEVFKKVTDLSMGARLKLVDSIAIDREHVVSWVDGAIHALHQYPIVHAKTLRNLLVARAQLASNVNPKLVLDRCFDM